MHVCKWLDPSGRLASCGVHVLKKGDRCHGDAGAGRGVGGKERMQNGGIDGSMDRWIDESVLWVGGTCGRVSSPLVRGMHGDVSLARLL
jgi:hypothetical protein